MSSTPVTPPPLQVTVAEAAAGIDFTAYTQQPVGVLHTGGGDLTVVSNLGKTDTVTMSAGQVYPWSIAQIMDCTGSGYVQFFFDSASLSAAAGGTLPAGAATAALQTAGNALLGGGLPAALGSQAASGSISQVTAQRVASASFRASAALPAAGAWSSDAAYAIPQGAKRVSFGVSYTGAGAGCAVQYRFLKGFSATLAAMATEQVTPGSVTPGSAPVATVLTYDLVSQRPVTATTATIFACDYDVEGGWTHCALQLAEYGTTGSPGTAAITVAASY
jgi:hypothetical protein